MALWEILYATSSQLESLQELRSPSVLLKFFRWVSLLAMLWVLWWLVARLTGPADFYRMSLTYSI